MLKKYALIQMLSLLALLGCNNSKSSDNETPPSGGTGSTGSTGTPSTPIDPATTPTTPTTTTTSTNASAATNHWIQADCLVNGNVSSARTENGSTARTLTLPAGTTYGCHIRYHMNESALPSGQTANCTLSGGNISGQQSVPTDSGANPYYVQLAVNSTWQFSCNNLFTIQVITNLQ